MRDLGLFGGLVFDRAFQIEDCKVIDRAESARQLFKYYPRWQGFMKELGEKRDEKSAKEVYTRSAICHLAHVVGRSEDDLLGQYFSTQAGNPAALNDLMECYDEAYIFYYGKPSGAFPGRS